MNLAIDIGNTHIKAAVFEDGLLVETFKSKSADGAFVEQVFTAYPAIGSAIIATVRGPNPEVEKAVAKRVKDVLLFTTASPIPIKSKYTTPETLGQDRLAAAVGANAIYPDCNVVIFDFGTAMTVDVVSKKGVFLGGNISPGLDTRFMALHEYTTILPLLGAEGKTALVGNSSETALRSGVVNGMQYEIERYIELLSAKYDDLKIIFTGGDGKFFAKKLKNTIFATYDLVVHGLNRILEYNED